MRKCYHLIFRLYALTKSTLLPVIITIWCLHNYKHLNTVLLLVGLLVLRLVQMDSMHSA